MTLITHILQQECSLVETTKDRYGDQTSTSETPVACRFRYVTELDKQVDAEGSFSSDAIIWLEPEVEVSEADIVKAEGLYWRVERVIKARKLAGSDVQFKKCYVNRHKLVEGEAS